MATDWVPIKLADVIEVKHGFAFKGEHFTESPVETVCLTPGNFMVGGGFKVGKPKYYEGPIDKNYVLSGDELVLTMTDLSRAADTLGYPAIVPKTESVTYLHNQRIGLVSITAEDLVCKEYLYFLLCSKQYRDEVLASVSGSTVKHTSPTKICNFKTIIPPIAEQKAIANILGTLDDKIELNHRMNETLESIARAIFKSWFVDFDPVRAKLEGNAHEQQSRTSAYPMPAEVYDLFPSAFQESELGKIPEGWEVGVFEDLLVLQRGFDLPKSKRLVGVHPVYAAGGYHGSHSDFRVKGPGVPGNRYRTTGIQNCLWLCPQHSRRLAQRNVCWLYRHTDRAKR